MKAKFRSLIKLGNWVIRSGKNGNNPVNPFTGHWLSTGWSFIVIVGFGIANGVYKFVVNVLLEGFALVLSTVVDIGSGLWHSDHKFTRWALSNLWSAGIAVFSALGMITKTVAAASVSILVIIFNMLR